MLLLTLCVCCGFFGGAGPLVSSYNTGVLTALTSLHYTLGVPYFPSCRWIGNWNNWINICGDTLAMVCTATYVLSILFWQFPLLYISWAPKYRDELSCSLLLVILETVVGFSSFGSEIITIVHFCLAQQFVHTVCCTLSVVSCIFCASSCNRYLCCATNTDSNSTETMSIKLWFYIMASCVFCVIGWSWDLDMVNGCLKQVKGWY